MNMFSKDQPIESMQRMTISIVDNETNMKYRNKDRLLAVQKSGRVVLGDEGLKRLEVSEGDYILFGQVGSSWYVCKRPSNSFKGYRIIRQQGKNAKSLYVQSQQLKDIVRGEYGLGDSFSQDGVFWREMLLSE